MRILIEAHHPAHIHFWKYPVRELRNRGHEVLMIGRDRDVMRRLLEVYDWIPSVIPPRKNKKNRFPLVELLQRQWTVAKWIRRFKPDAVASLMGSYTQSARLFGVRNIIFTDSEFQHFNHRIAHPFADPIYTPECFYKDLGRKQRKYAGIHELMFLDPAYFEPDPSVVKRYGGLTPGSYVLVRMSAWNTFHDRGQSGVGDAIRSFVGRHKDRLRFLVSGEEDVLTDLPGIECVQIEAEDYHDLIHHAAFVLTEGASTASEAACLAVPTVCINSTEERGYLRMLEKRYGIVESFKDSVLGMRRADEWLTVLPEPDLGKRAELRQRILADHPDRCGYVVKVLLGETETTSHEH